jgi:hypothetical protein
MARLVADARRDLIELAELGDASAQRPGLLDRHAELVAFLREYAGLEGG